MKAASTHITRISNLKTQDIEKLAYMHQMLLHDSFLNNFGISFLRLLYYVLIPDNKNIVLIVKQQKNIVGFIVATTQTSTFMKRVFISEKSASLLWEMVKTLIKKPYLIYKIVRWMPKKNLHSESDAELQFMAVDSKMQRTGVGTKLLLHLHKEFLRKKITQYKVGTKSKSSVSNSFYKKSGFRFLGSTIIFGDTFNYYTSPSLA